MSSHVSNIYYPLQMLKQRWLSLGNCRQRIKLLQVEVEMHMAKELHKVKVITLESNEATGRVELEWNQPLKWGRLSLLNLLEVLKMKKRRMKETSSYQSVSLSTSLW